MDDRITRRDVLVRSGQLVLVLAGGAVVAQLAPGCEAGEDGLAGCTLIGHGTFPYVCGYLDGAYGCAYDVGVDAYCCESPQPGMDYCGISYNCQSHPDVGQKEYLCQQYERPR